MLDKVFVIDGSAVNAEEAIKTTGSKLMEEGYVKESFINACLEREKVFPTGLPTEIGVAIPHCDAIHVNKPAICVLRLSKPVQFQNMGGEEAPVNCEYIMNLALHKQEDQVVLLSRIIKMVQDTEFLRKIKFEDKQEVEEQILNLLEEE